MTQQPQQQPEPLDLDAWLDDVDLPVADVTIYAKASLVNEHDRLTDQIRQQTLADARVDDEDRGIDHGARVAQLEQQRADVLTQMRASARTFHLRGLTQEQHASITARLRDPNTGQVDREAHLAESIAAMAGLPIEKVQQLRKRLPFSQWVKLTEAATTLLVGGVDLPFS